MSEEGHNRVSNRVASKDSNPANSQVMRRVASPASVRVRGEQRLDHFRRRLVGRGAVERKPLVVVLCTRGVRVRGEERLDDFEVAAPRNGRDSRSNVRFDRTYQLRAAKGS